MHFMQKMNSFMWPNVVITKTEDDLEPWWYQAICRRINHCKNVCMHHSTFVGYRLFSVNFYLFRMASQVPCHRQPWWRHQMETFSALLAICAENSPVPGEFPAQRPVTRSFDVSLISARKNGWVNNGEAGDLRHHHAHYDVTVMPPCWPC